MHTHDRCIDIPEAAIAPYMTTSIRYIYPTVFSSLVILLIAALLLTSACSDDNGQRHNDPQSLQNDTGQNDTGQNDPEDSSMTGVEGNQTNTGDAGSTSEEQNNGFSQSTIDTAEKFTITLSNYTDLLSEGLKLTRSTTILALVDTLEDNSNSWNSSWESSNEDNAEAIEEMEVCELGGKMTREVSRESDLSINYQSTLLFENCAFGDYELSGVATLARKFHLAGHGTTMNSDYTFQKLEISERNGQFHEFTGTLLLKASATGFTNHYVLENKIDYYKNVRGADQISSISNAYYKQEFLYSHDYNADSSAENGSYFKESGFASEVVVDGDKSFSLLIEPDLEYQIINKGSSAQRRTDNLVHGSVTLVSTLVSTGESRDGSKLSVTALDGDAVLYTITQSEDEYQIEDSWWFAATCHNQAIFNLPDC